uniref:Uncharacterized protein n=1 Tax=Anguilla anguilla TaxID=7936 RepID=A0A0E9TXK8_ANGAN
MLDACPITFTGPQRSGMIVPSFT